MIFKSIRNRFKRFSSLFLTLTVTVGLSSTSSFATDAHSYFIRDDNMSCYIPLQQQYALNTKVGDKVFERIDGQPVELSVEKVSCVHLSMQRGCIKTFVLRKDGDPLYQDKTVSIHISYWQKLKYDLACAAPYVGATVLAYGAYKLCMHAVIPGLAKVMTGISPYFKGPLGY
ncbi:MAG: hypothetical protein WCE21_01980 [Candidatus Babeliales bacterium]